MPPPLLSITGEVDHPLALDWAALAAVQPQVADVSSLDPKRTGAAITLAGLLKLAQVRPAAKYLGLHSSRDDFHASIPLAAVKNSAVLIYSIDGQPLPLSAGGPIRFLVPDLAACHTAAAADNIAGATDHSAEIDECANVKYLDSLELTSERGYDNRPTEEEEHAELHRRQGGQ